MSALGSDGGSASSLLPSLRLVLQGFDTLLPPLQVFPEACKLQTPDFCGEDSIHMTTESAQEVRMPCSLC